MKTLPFQQLPLVVKMAVGLTFYNAWLLIEELLINRSGLWRYMPYYKVASACVWDLAVAVVITLALWRASTRGSQSSADGAPHTSMGGAP